MYVFRGIITVITLRTRVGGWGGGEGVRRSTAEVLFFFSFFLLSFFINVLPFMQELVLDT